MKERDAAIVAVGPGNDAAAARVKRLFGIGYPVFGDPKLQVYSLFGYDRVLAVVRQSGTIVVDRDGRIVFRHRTANPFDALPFDAVLAALSNGASR